jgi:hypothetical protein
MHREVCDFAKQKCDDCHEAERSGLKLRADACSARCHHRHGKEQMSKEGHDIHKVHKDAACAHCHVKAEHKISAAKFNSKTLAVFEKDFSHAGGHADEKCSSCHTEEGGHFALALKGSADCTACHHAEVDDTESCDACHESKKIEAFGKKFAHKSHEEKCTQCHVKGAKDLTLALKSRGDCNACHHEGVDDPESCEGCHENQQAFFSGEGNKKYGIPETPSEAYVDVEKACITCHGEDVTRYEPNLARKTCIECHEDDADYNPDNLVNKGKEALEKLVLSFTDTEARVKSAKNEGLAPDKISKAEGALTHARKMLSFLRKDASFGIHNPGLFEAYLGKIGEVLKEAKDAVK